jgi:hypothetical protein
MMVVDWTITFLYKRWMVNTTARPARSEWLGLFLLLLGFGIFNLLTCNYYPTIWGDEVWFAEPAVNKVTYGTFITRIWQLQPFNTFPVVNCPLYTMTLVPWLTLTGTSILAVRSLNYVLMGTTGFLFWLALWRFGWVRSAKLRLLAVAALHLGYGMSYCYRCSRPDMLGLNCLLLLLLSLQTPSALWRGMCLALLGATTVWIGLQVALFGAFAAGLWWLLYRKGFRELVVLGAGMVLGAVSLVLFISSKGVLSYFLAHALGFVGKSYAQANHSLGRTVGRVVQGSLRNYVEDFSLMVVMLGLAVLLVVCWKRLSQETRRLVLYCLGLLILVPPLFNTVGHFAFYYSCMRFLPGVLALFAIYSELKCSGSQVSRGLQFLFAGIVAAAGMVGLPMRLLLAPLMYHIAPRSEIRRVVQETVKTNDVVFVRQAAFFEAKAVTPNVYDIYSSPVFQAFPMPWSRDFSEAQKREMSLIIVWDSEMPSVTKFFGGTWAPVTPPFGDSPNYEKLRRLPLIGNRLIHYAEQPQNIRLPLQAFRRTTSEAPSAKPAAQP